LVDLGIGMSHFELTTNANGLSGKWEIDTSENIDIPDEFTYVTTWFGFKKNL
jgi:hypothetical protein